MSLLLLAMLVRLAGPQVAAVAGADPLTQAVAQAMVASLVSSLTGSAVVLGLLALMVGGALLYLDRTRRTQSAPAVVPAPETGVVTG